MSASVDAGGTGAGHVTGGLLRARSDGVGDGKSSVVTGLVTV